MKRALSIFIFAAILVFMITIFSGCGTEKCANGCGNDAAPECWADMCDSCCNYWSGLNGCRADH